MSDQVTLTVLVRLAAAFMAAFPAIALWSKTRDAAWMFVVLGSLFLFIDALFSTLVRLGLLSYEMVTLMGFPFLEPLIAGLPYLFLLIGFLVFLARKKRY